MFKMEPLKNKGINRQKRLILLSFIVMIILLGFAFSASNIYKFAKGYMAYETTSPSSKVKETTTKHSKEVTETDLYPVRPKIGEEMGELYIPKLNATLPIYHGTNEDELEKGVGHFAESVLPGENDNTVLSGHRDTVFRKLGGVGEGDWLIV